MSTAYAEQAEAEKSLVRVLSWSKSTVTMTSCMLLGREKIQLRSTWVGTREVFSRLADKILARCPSKYVGESTPEHLMSGGGWSQVPDLDSKFGGRLVNRPCSVYLGICNWGSDEGLHNLSFPVVD